MPPRLKTVAKDQAQSDLAAARRVFAFAGEAIRSLSDTLDGAFTRAVDTLLAIKGRVVVSGMGKSGHVGRKIAATLASTGTPAQFIHPAEASHGDLGALTRQDAVLMLSWRGETAELSDLITYAKRFHIPLIGVAGNAESTLLQAADVALLLPNAREACPMGLAPTTSTTLMLVLGDALAVALMERRGFSADQYRDFHPGGSLGRALIRVSDLMHTGDEIPLVGERDAVPEVLIAIAEHRFGCVGVVDRKGALAGIITDGDLRRHMGADIMKRSARDIMTAGPKIAAPDQLAAEALGVMNEKKITQLFVLDPKDRGRKPKGILHIHDCLRAGLG
ncbi:MAG: KpsF/GutQ family sugar-phosphate isomerase [Alphaproteobacteria bacterium]|nr:KpsF/GutQ family sugar-phosphate isomerase [Alphaproteobacteria bacterium]